MQLDDAVFGLFHWVLYHCFHRIIEQIIELDSSKEHQMSIYFEFFILLLFFLSISFVFTRYDHMFMTLTDTIHSIYNELLMKGISLFYRQWVYDGWCYNFNDESHPKIRIENKNNRPKWFPRRLPQLSHCSQRQGKHPFASFCCETSLASQLAGIDLFFHTGIYTALKGFKSKGSSFSLWERTWSEGGWWERALKYKFRRVRACSFGKVEAVLRRTGAWIHEKFKRDVVSRLSWAF